VPKNAQRQAIRLSLTLRALASLEDMKVLLVEDESKLAALVQRVLTAEGHVVDPAPDAVSAVALATSGEYDVAIVDRMLPDMDGLDLIRILRSKHVRTPVLMLTALGSVEQRVAGLDAGANDYLPKPFAFSELLARIRALGRRDGPSATGRLLVGDIELDEVRHAVRVADRSVDLSAREFALLGFLIRHPGQVLTRRQILDGVWGAEPDVYSNVVDLYIHYLRRKLGELGRAGRLRTVRGVGYSLRVDG
jgi:DNA-binding response OmpR family regulator